MKKIMRFTGLLIIFAALAACGDSDPKSGKRTEEGDRAELAAMRAAIAALVGEECDSIGDCRFAGIGAKPCGGPWAYVMYSTASTDSAALAERLEEYNAFEADMNQRYEYSSDCSVPNEPVLGCEAGRCVDLLQGSGDDMQGSENPLQGSGTVSIAAGAGDEPAPAAAGLPRFAIDMEVASDAFDLREARVEGDILTLVVSYSGGCAAHDFRLLASLAATKSIPPQHQLKLVHQANGDACEAYLTNALRFDLTPFRGLYSGLGGVAFRLEGVEGVLDYVF